MPVRNTWSTETRVEVIIIIARVNMPAYCVDVPWFDPHPRWSIAAA